ncbi:MAG: hypothetical protein ACYSW0_16285, partial [Planctomycetota bacterium]
MKRVSVVIGVLCAAVIFLGLWIAFSSSEIMGEAAQIARAPNISPDYSGLIIPYNIAPLNFRILEKGKSYHVRIHSDNGPAIEIAGKTGQIRIPLRKWRALLDANKGREIFVDVCAKNAKNEWVQFQRITNTVAKEGIDRTVV